MSVIDTVKVIKKTQTTNIIMIKIGKFIYSYGKDACIISYIFKYKIRQLEDNTYVCAFPKNKLNNIMAILENKKINYLVLDKRNSYRVDEKSNNKNINKYEEYMEKAIRYVKRKRKIDYIYSNLLNNIENNEVDETILSIKKVIDERRKI